MGVEDGNADHLLLRLDSAIFGVYSDEFLHVLDLLLLTEESHHLLDGLSESHFEFDQTEGSDVLVDDSSAVVVGGEGDWVDLGPVLDDWSLGVERS